jgi:hypothetical protein
LHSQALYELTGYAAQKSPFYQQHNQEGRLDQAYKRGLQAVHELVQRQTQASLFDQYRPTVTRTVARPPFADTRYAGHKAPIKLADVHPWSAATRLTGALQQVIKYTENVLRAEAGFRGRLRGIDLPADWTTAIDRAFAQPKPQRAITLDLARVAELHSAADALRERLFVEEAESSASTPLPVTEESPPVVMPAPTVTEPEQAAALRNIVGEPDSISAHLLRLLWQQDWQAPPAQLAAAAPGHFLHVLLDEINARAVDQLGDALLLEGANGWQVNEEYQAGLAALFDQPSIPEVSTSAPAGGSLGAPLPNPHEADPAWAGFAEQLQPHHWELLHTLVQGAGDSAALEAIARRGYSTANQLIDEINAAALDHLGDLVIDASVDPPGIVAEAEEVLRVLIKEQVNLL